VAEYGRQPWSISEVLPVHMSVSSLGIAEVTTSLSAIMTLYLLLFIAEMYLMIRFARKGPSSLHTGQYHFETNSTPKSA
jgi:cytochrome d ubiquinol oxidase subunit I